MPRPFGLSKSKILAGRQCPKRLWLEVHRRDLAVVSPELERAFRLGHEVGDVARSLYSGGVLVESETLREALHLTKALLAESRDLTIYEATLDHLGVLVRADVLRRRGGRHHLVEVKSSSAVKDYHLEDAAVQAWVLGGAGVPLDTIAIAHVDTSFVYPGGGDYRGLLREVEVTDTVRPLLVEVPRWVAGLREVLAGEMPAIVPDGQCHDPFDCPFHAFCTEGWPEYHVYLLPRGRAVAEALIAEGYEDLRDVPDGRLTSNVHVRIWRATRQACAELGDGAALYLSGVGFPRHYLDFETIAFAVPVWRGTRPWEQLPFQWSLHVEHGAGHLEHTEFLDTSGDDPSRDCALSLLRALGDTGPIVVYTGFEKAVLTGLAARHPDLSVALEAVVARLVDLYPVAQATYYHPAMKGSWSLKAMLPTVAPDLDYAAGEVRDGGMAQDAYREVLDPATSVERREALRRALLDYCELDTLALVRLAHFLARA